MAHTANADTKAVGIWVRVSTEDQARGESPEHHERRARAFCEARDWRVVEFYSLEAVSGKSVIGHPEAQRMITDIRSGRITGLVFSKLARLARNTKELLDFAEIFRACGADLVSLQESIDTSSPAGRLFFTMIAAMAQWEREEISERVAASVPIRAKLGKQTGGAAPFGYQWLNKELVPHPEEAPVRVLLYELYAEHKRKKRVARILNERGYRTRRGELFSDSSVGRLITDPTAKGLHRANYTTTADKTKPWTLKPESEWVYRQVPAIVSDELWESCNRTFAAQATRPPSRTTRHLFAGFAHCTCGGKMYVWAQSPKYICATCRNKIPVDDLEAVYRDQLRHFIISPEEIRAHSEAAQEAIREKEKLVEAGEAELRKINSEDERLYQLYLADKLTMDDFGRRHDPLTARRSQLEEELPRLQAECDVLKLSLLSRSEALEEARDLSDRWGDLPFEERRHIVEAITDRIVVGQEDIEITLLHLPSGTNGVKATRTQGFCAAISCTRAG
jgi:site-specific DNA recombinase